MFNIIQQKQNSPTLEKSKTPSAHTRWVLASEDLGHLRQLSNISNRKAVGKDPPIVPLQARNPPCLRIKRLPEEDVFVPKPLRITLGVLNPVSRPLWRDKKVNVATSFPDGLLQFPRVQRADAPFPSLF